MSDRRKKDKQTGRYMAIGIAMDDLTLGIAIGVAIGAAMAAKN